MRWALIGAGDIAEKRVAPALRDLPQCVPVVVARKRAHLAAEFASRFGFARASDTWREAVTSADVEAVYVATTVSTHREITIAALKAGKHVLCEKPIAMSASEGEEMVSVARESGRSLGVAYYRHFYPLVARLRELLAEGAIGTPGIAHAEAFEYFDPPQDHPRAWLLDPAVSGGGPMMDFGCHRIEVLTSLFGEVVSACGERANARFRRAVEDSGVVTMRFGQGVVATVAVSHAIGERSDRLEIHGEIGSITCPHLNGDELHVRTDGKEWTERHAPAANVHQPLIEDFEDAIRDRREPRVSGSDALVVTRVLDAFYGRA